MPTFTTSRLPFPRSPCCRRRKAFLDYSLFIWHLWLHCHRRKTEWRLNGERSDWNRSVMFSGGTGKMQVDIQCSNKFLSWFSHRSAAFSSSRMWLRGWLNSADRSDQMQNTREKKKKKKNTTVVILCFYNRNWFGQHRREENNTGNIGFSWCGNDFFLFYD